MNKLTFFLKNVIENRFVLESNFMNVQYIKKMSTITVLHRLYNSVLTENFFSKTVGGPSDQDLLIFFDRTTQTILSG
jgi:hypothetical protein